MTLSNLYESVGTFTVTVTVQDIEGQTDFAAFVVTVKDPLVPGTVAFTQTATLSTGATGDTLAAGDFTGDGIVDID